MAEASRLRRTLLQPTLRMFWSGARVSAWSEQIFKKGNTEVCYNLMCLAPSVHKYWEKGYFALKPIKLSDDKKSLEIKFYWLKIRNRGDTTILQRPILSGESKNGPNMTKLMNCDNEKVICSRDRIFLKTNKPEEYPLTNFQLLEVQWFLHRVTAMSAAAEPQDKFGDDSDDDLPGVGQFVHGGYAGCEYDGLSPSMREMIERNQ
jgi:hypothetical protein